MYEGLTTGTPIALLIRNTDARSKDYGTIAEQFRPGHADYTYWQKYGIRDPRGGGRSSARETTMRVAAAVIARKWLADTHGVRVQGWLSQIGEIVPRGFDAAAIETNPFFWPDAAQVGELETYMDALRKSGDSVGARVTVVADGVPPGWGEPIYGKLDGELAAAMMSINAVKGVEIGDGFAAVAQKGSAHRDEMPRATASSPTMPAASSAAFPAASRCWCRWRSSRPPACACRVAAVDVDGKRSRDRHHRPPRPLRRHPRNTDLRGDAGAGADGPGAAASRAMRRRGRGVAADSRRASTKNGSGQSRHPPPRATTVPQRYCKHTRQKPNSLQERRKPRPVSGTSGRGLRRSCNNQGRTKTMNKQFKVAVVGATGAVGEAMLSILAERKLPGQRSGGAGERTFGGRQRRRSAMAELAGAGPGQLRSGRRSTSPCSRPVAASSKEYAPKFAAAGAVVIDNSSAFRYDDDVPLVVSEVNPEAVANRPRGIIANPNCSTMQMMVALKPIHDAAGIERINVATYQSVSGGGRSGAGGTRRADRRAAQLPGRSIRSASRCRSPST